MPDDLSAFLAQLLSDRLFHLCFSLPYSRFIETEADEFGIKLAARVNFKQNLKLNLIKIKK